MKARCIAIEESDLFDYLKKNWRGFDTKDYELLTALVVARFHRGRFGKNYRIGFPIDQRHCPVDMEYNSESIEKIIKSFIDEDTPIDFFLTAEEDIKETAPVGKARGLAFQIKRIRKNSEFDKTETILKFLKETIPNKYSPVQASLILVMGESGDDGKPHIMKINVEEIKKKFHPDKYPFDRIMFMSNSGTHSPRRTCRKTPK